MKLLNHSAVAIRAIRAAALVLLLGAALPLAAQTAIAESPSGKMLTQAGVDSIVDSVGAVWTLGPADASGFPTKARNGVVDGSAAVLCYSDRSVNARVPYATRFRSSIAVRAILAAALVLLLGAALPLAAQTAIAESPSGKMLTQAGVDSIVDSVGAVWTLGPSDASGFPTKARNGVVDGSAAVLCYSDRSVNARGDLAGGWWKWTDDATLLLKGSWSSVSTTPIGCVVAPAGDTTPPRVPAGLAVVAI